MRRVTARAALAHCFMLENEWTTLRGMALGAGFIEAEKKHAAAFDLLREIRFGAFERLTFVRVVAINAAHFALQDWMAMREIEFRAHLEMALETGLRIAVRINNAAATAAGLDVFATGTVTAFAAHHFGVFALGLEACVRGSAEIAHDLAVAGVACLGPDKFRAWNAGRRHDGAVRFEAAAREQHYGQYNQSARAPKKSLGPSVDPSS